MRLLQVPQSKFGSSQIKEPPLLRGHEPETIGHNIKARPLVISALIGVKDGMHSGISEIRAVDTIRTL